MDKIIARCILCSGEFNEEEIYHKNCCPNCKTKSIPLDPAEDINIGINFHELSILFNWAYFYSCSTDDKKLDDPNWESLKETVKLIAGRVRKTFPDNLKSKSLYIAEEMKEIEEKFPGSTLSINGKEQI